MGKKIVKNYPSPRLMETIGATNQKPAEAIGELVANCFDARPEFGAKVNIVVTMGDDQITVLDDAKGMTEDILEKAVCIGEDMSRYYERNSDAKGYFGMGFKTSCATLGHFYEIYTRPMNEDVEYHVAFDIDNYSKRQSGADAWDIEIDDGPKNLAGPLGETSHGTAFVIRDLKNKDIPVSSVLSYLADAFRGELKTGSTIKIISPDGSANDAIPEEYNYLPGSRVEIDEYCGPNDKYHIVGWVALDRQTHNNGNYGFNIYRHNQLIEKWNKSWFRNHLMQSRIIGEVDLDFLEATFYKQGLQQNEAWTIVSEHMKQFLKPFASASSNLNKNKNSRNPAKVRTILNDMRDNYDLGPIAGSITASEESEIGNDDSADECNGSEAVVTNDSAPSKTIKTATKPIVKERSLLLEDGTEISIDYTESQNSNVEEKGPFDYILDQTQEPAQILVICYADHPIWEKEIDSETRRILATSDSVYRALVEQYNYDPHNALKIRNTWIWQRVARTESGGRDGQN